ncbi:aldo/keto reductase [Arthrobacter sp. MMS24-S77]
MSLNTHEGSIVVESGAPSRCSVRAQSVVRKGTPAPFGIKPEPQPGQQGPDPTAFQICWSPLAQGVLTGKYIPGQDSPPASRFATEEGGLKTEHKFMRPEVLERAQALKPVAEEAGLSMAALALAWVLQNSNVSAAIVGASRPDQLVDNATAVGIKLDPELLARIDTILDPVIERDPAKVESFTTRP